MAGRNTAGVCTDACAGGPPEDGGYRAHHFRPTISIAQGCKEVWGQVRLWEGLILPCLYPYALFLSGTTGVEGQALMKTLTLTLHGNPTIRASLAIALDATPYPTSAHGDRKC